MITKRAEERFRHVLGMFLSAAEVYRDYLDLPRATEGVPGFLAGRIRGCGMNLGAVDMVNSTRGLVTAALVEIHADLLAIPGVRQTTLDYVREALSLGDVAFSPLAGRDANFAPVYEAGRHLGGVPTIIYEYVEKEKP